MIVSLVLTDRYNIGIDSNDRFLYGTKCLNIKDIPFVRYRFSEFVDSDVGYIKKMMSKFQYSTHLVELIIEEGYDTVLEKLNSEFENLAIFLYLPVNDHHVETCELTDNDEHLLGKLDGSYSYDRIMLKDFSDTLHLVSANKLKSEVAKITGDDAMDMGVCNSPLSFGNDACITALRARVLSSMYAHNDDCALPSANHESMNTCGCIKYVEVEEDLQAYKKGHTTSKKSKGVDGIKSNLEKKEKKHRKKLGSKVLKPW